MIPILDRGEQSDSPGQGMSTGMLTYVRKSESIRRHGDDLAIDSWSWSSCDDGPGLSSCHNSGSNDIGCHYSRLVRVEAVMVMELRRPSD